MKHVCPVCRGELSGWVDQGGVLRRYHCVACGRDFPVSEIHALEHLKKREGVVIA